MEEEIHKAASMIAVRCRRVIQGLLRDEEIVDADAEFRRIAHQVIRELSAFKAK